MHTFSSESEMQEWLLKELQGCYGLADLIIDCEVLKDFKPNNIEEAQVLKSFNTCLAALYVNTLVSSNENISLKKVTH